MSKNNSVSVHIDSKYKWDSNVIDEHNYGIGDENSIINIINKIKDMTFDDHAQISEIIASQSGNFAAIIETKNFIVAFVDTIRSYPVFYFHNADKLEISNSARLLKKKSGIEEVDQASLIEFCMAGYVTGRETIYKGIYQLQAGEFLIWNKSDRKLILDRYFNYFPTNEITLSESEYIEKLGNVIDDIFHRLIEKADDEPIWIPLSGGLDSRLIICKLKEFGYDNLHAFSYGPSGNYEAREAKYIAKKLNVPWVYIKPNASRSRNLFQSFERKDYSAFSDGLCNLPVMNDFESVHVLRQNSQLSEKAIIINGQSGDFITGGHIPSQFVQDKLLNASLLVNTIINKHFSVWKHLKTETNLNTITDKIRLLLNIDMDTVMSAEIICAFYEQWEWQERQSKLVVNGQRCYDYYGYRWELPLWSPLLMKFFISVPLEFRMNRKLYIQYLSKWNYQGLFSNFQQPRKTNYFGNVELFMRIVSKLNSLLGLSSETINKYFSYYGHYGDHYALYGFNYFFKNIHNAMVPPAGRGVLALGIKMWLTENGLDMKVKL